MRRLGSSPRMRGKLPAREIRRLPGGLIPAHAGKTRASVLLICSARAHPRACGENAAGPTRSFAVKGSSPRMRGKLPPSSAAAGYAGLIPAHAGKTPSPYPRWSTRRAHPRACGENTTRTNARGQGKGSSPRMRGKREHFDHDAARRGLIPAHAGKTVTKVRAVVVVGAHPRACGENALPVSHRRDGDGSSPRMRGKLSIRPGENSSARLIPAHAGKTDTRAAAGSSTGAHPRACGENAENRDPASASSGSSPRMRGKR